MPVRTPRYDHAWVAHCQLRDGTRIVSPLMRAKDQDSFVRMLNRNVRPRKIYSTIKLHSTTSGINAMMGNCKRMQKR
jgi:hypothetical protein